MIPITLLRALIAVGISDEALTVLAEYFGASPTSTAARAGWSMTRSRIQSLRRRDASGRRGVTPPRAPV